VAFEAAAAFLEGVSERLATTLNEHRAAAPEEASALVTELERLIGAGGKRIRPLFCYWGYRAFEAGESTPPSGPELDALATAGAAIELVHTAAIVHDDLIDDSLLRRGVPSAHRHLAALHGGKDELGRAGAVLVGDLAQALADHLLATAAFPPERVLDAFEAFTRMREDAAYGEFLDVLAAPPVPNADLPPVEAELRARRVASLKSGSYTVTGPLLVGAALAGATPGVRSALRAYGAYLGEAFQLRDDVLGLFGDPAVTGKDREGDVRWGKETVLVAKARAAIDPAAWRLLRQRLGDRDLTSSQVEEVRTAIRDSGALGQTLELIERLASEAVAAVDGAFAWPTEQALSELATLVVVRDA